MESPRLVLRPAHDDAVVVDAIGEAFVASKRPQVDERAGCVQESSA